MSADDEQGMTAAEIDALPFGSVVADRDGDEYTRSDNGWIIMAGDVEDANFDASDMLVYQPVRLVSTP